MNFRYRLMQFMSGRYGTDALTNALLIFGAVVSFINIFLRSWIIQLFVYGVIIFAIYRVMSRNHEARRKENRFFNEKLNVFKSKIEIYKNQKNDKFHVYRKCPACEAVLKLPHRIGEHTTVCPRCGREFKVKVRK